MAKNRRSMMRTNYGDEKYDKSKELNASMTIAPSARDAYERTMHNIRGGSESGN